MRVSAVEEGIKGMRCTACPDGIKLGKVGTTRNETGDRKGERASLPFKIKQEATRREGHQSLSSGSASSNLHVLYLLFFFFCATVMFLYPKAVNKYVNSTYYREAK